MRSFALFELLIFSLLCLRKVRGDALHHGEVHHWQQQQHDHDNKHRTLDENQEETGFVAIQMSRIQTSVQEYDDLPSLQEHRGFFFAFDLEDEKGHGDHFCSADELQASLLAKDEILMRVRQAERRRRRVALCNQCIVIDTYFHVISDNTGSIGDVQKQPILQQMAKLNKAYEGSPFQFDLKGTTRTYNTSLYSLEYSFQNFVPSMQYDIGSLLREGDQRTLNIYSAHLRDKSLGLATLPPSSAGEKDGVFVDFCTLPGGTCTPYNEGDIAVHEVGHWLGLMHIFEGGCNELHGDYVSDTPAQAGAIFGCTPNMDTCPDEEGEDALDNYMGYAIECFERFTPGQWERMHDQWFIYRDGTGACEANQGIMSVEIRLDMNPEENFWRLYHANGQLISKHEFGASEEDSLYTANICVPYDVPLYFGLQDTMKNGLASSQDSYYRISVDDKLIKDDRSFQKWGGAAFTLLNDDSCLNGESLVVIELLLDRYPEETSWVIQDSQGSIIYIEDEYKFAGYDVSYYSGASIRREICVPSGEFYFEISDTYGDGLSEAETGDVPFYRVTVNGKVLIKVDTFDGTVQRTPFTVVPLSEAQPLPKVASNAPTQSPTDSPTTKPSLAPSKAPTAQPTLSPTNVPTIDYMTRISTVPGFVSEVSYDTDEDFVEVAVPALKNTSDYSVVIYKYDGNVDGAYPLGDVVDTDHGYDVYLLDATTIPDFVDIKYGSAIALVNGDGGIDQFIGFKYFVEPKEGTPAFGSVTQMIGLSTGSLVTEDLGQTYYSQEGRTPGELSSPTPSGAPSLSPSSRPSSEEYSSYIEGLGWYISEVHYDEGDTKDFVEMAIPKGSNTIGALLVVYNKDGEVVDSFSLGEVVSENLGQQLYLLDKETNSTFPGLAADDALALVNGAGIVEQFLCFEEYVTAVVGAVHDQDVLCQMIGPSSYPLATEDGGVTYVGQLVSTPGVVEEPTIRIPTVPGFFSEVSYDTDEDFVEVAVPALKNTSNYSVVIYKYDGNVDGAYPLGDVVDTDHGYDVYLLDSTTIPDFVDIKYGSAIALVNGDGGIDQFIGFKYFVEPKEGTSAFGRVTQVIGLSTGSLVTEDLGQTYYSQEGRTPGELSSPTPSGAPSLSPSSRPSSEEYSSYIEGLGWYISEVHYDEGDTKDFVEMAIPKGSNTIGALLVVYNKDGEVVDSFSLGEVVSENLGQQLYLLDKETNSTFPGLAADDALALVNGAGIVEQFLCFEEYVTAVVGAVHDQDVLCQMIGPSSYPLATEDGGVTYVGQLVSTPGVVEEPTIRIPTVPGFFSEVSYDTDEDFVEVAVPALKNTSNYSVVIYKYDGNVDDAYPLGDVVDTDHGYDVYLLDSTTIPDFVDIKYGSAIALVNGDGGIDQFIGFKYFVEPKEGTPAFGRVTQVIGLSTGSLVTEDLGQTYYSQEGRTPGELSSPTPSGAPSLSPSSRPSSEEYSSYIEGLGWYISEVHYDEGDTKDFVEMAIPKGSNTIGALLVVYNKDGEVVDSFSLGEVVSENLGQQLYLLDKETNSTFPGLAADDALALVNGAGIVEQFLCFEEYVTAVVGAVHDQDVSCQMIGPSSYPLATEDGGVTYVGQLVSTPGVVEEPTIRIPTVPGFFSEVSYDTDGDFVEVAVPALRNTSNYSVVIYKYDGNVDDAYPLGDVVDTDHGYDVYLLNSTTIPDFVDIKYGSAIALVNGDGGIDQFIGFKYFVEPKEGTPAFGSVTQVIGLSTGSLVTEDLGQSYYPQESRTPST